MHRFRRTGLNVGTWQYEAGDEEEEEESEEDEEENTNNLSLVLEMLMPGRVGSPEMEVGRLLTNLSRYSCLLILIFAYIFSLSPLSGTSILIIII